MQPKTFTSLTNEQLLQKIKKMKSDKVLDAFIVGVTIGIVIYSAITNGFTFFTFFPLIITYQITRNASNNKLLEQELQKESMARNIDDNSRRHAEI